MGKFIDLTDRRFGKLVVIERADYSIDRSGRKYIMWKCQCDCGNTKEIRSSSLLRGEAVSCGCMYHATRKENSVKTNKKVRRLYMIWSDMKQRCYNKNCVSYKWYGAKGVSVCDEWINNFRNFEQWSYKNGYREDLTIERKDVNGNYCPENCCWVTKSEQQNNRRNTVRMKIDEKEYTLRDLAKESGINRNTLYFRNLNGVSGQDLLNEPQSIELNARGLNKYWKEKSLKVGFNGTFHAIGEWSKISGIKYSTLYNRYLTGDRGEHLFRKVRKKRNSTKEDDSQSKDLIVETN